MIDLSGFEKFIPDIASMLGVEPSTVLLLVGLIIAIANLGGRLIPDDKTGFLGFVRTACKLIGLYASNRISSGLTVNKIAETTAPIVQELDERIEQVDTVVKKAFPGLPDRDPVTGKFKKKES